MEEEEKKSRGSSKSVDRGQREELRSSSLRKRRHLHSNPLLVSGIKRRRGSRKFKFQIRPPTHFDADASPVHKTFSLPFNASHNQNENGFSALNREVKLSWAWGRSAAQSRLMEKVDLLARKLYSPWKSGHNERRLKLFSNCLHLRLFHSTIDARLSLLLRLPPHLKVVEYLPGNWKLITVQMSWQRKSSDGLGGGEGKVAFLWWILWQKATENKRKKSKGGKERRWEKRRQFRSHTHCVSILYDGCGHEILSNIRIWWWGCQKEIYISLTLFFLPPLSFFIFFSEAMCWVLAFTERKAYSPHFHII